MKDFRYPKLSGEKKVDTGGIAIPDLKISYRAIVIKIIWHQHRNRHVEQWTITKVSNMGKCNVSHLTFNKGAKIIYWRKRNSIFNKRCRKN